MSKNSEALLRRISTLVILSIDHRTLWGYRDISNGLLGADTLIGEKILVRAKETQ